MLLSNSCNSRAIYAVRKVSNIKFAAIWLTLACALTVSAQAATIIVSNTNDSGPGSLRQALAVANNGDTIDATGISGVITLTTGELLVDKSVTINGAAADLLAVDGNATSRVFQTVTGANGLDFRLDDQERSARLRRWHLQRRHRDADDQQQHAQRQRGGIRWRRLQFGNANHY